ncbi:MAG: hypothetical protein GXZ08_08735 [Tissierellia bacterium]|nr:hypothetical protein [Tissierellia bacterium]
MNNGKKKVYYINSYKLLVAFCILLIPNIYIAIQIYNSLIPILGKTFGEQIALSLWINTINPIKSNSFLLILAISAVLGFFITLRIAKIVNKRNYLIDIAVLCFIPALFAVMTALSGNIEYKAISILSVILVFIYLVEDFLLMWILKKELTIENLSRDKVFLRGKLMKKYGLEKEGNQ